MLLRNIKLIVLVGLLFFTFTVQIDGRTQAWRMIHGDVVQIFPEHQKILLESEGQKSIFVLDSDCAILRSGKPTTLEALHPIASGVYQDALCWINPKGMLSYIMVNYQVQEENGNLLNYDIFGNLK